MASMKRPRLTAAQAMPGHLLKLTFRNGASYVLRFAEFFDESPGLAPLRNENAFRLVQMDKSGWIVEWPDLDIQIGADTLWLDAQAQNAVDENTRIFAQWRARNGLTLADAALALEMAPRTISAYGTGARPVPRHIALACKGWEAEHRT